MKAPALLAPLWGSSPDAAKDITTRTVYDGQGREIATVQPNAVAANPNTFVPAHAGTRLTSYYTASGAGDCVNASYEGWLCKTTFAGNAAGGKNLITEKTTTYNPFGQATVVVETGSDSASRTTTSTYDSADRLVTTQITGTLGHPVPKTTYTYHPTLGLETKVTPASGAAIERTYDAWGRETSYTTGSGTSQTQYDHAGRVHKLSDNNSAGSGTLTYSYNTTTGAAQDYRGLLTKIVASNPGGRTVGIGGTYDAEGRLVTQTSPGGIAQHTEYDTDGNVTAMRYDIGNASDVLAWSQTHDALRRVVTTTTPDADTQDAVPTLDSATIQYTYDRAARLTKVIDTRTAMAGEPECWIREYAFDKNGNRTSKQTDSCSSSSGSFATTWSYDAADRFDSGSGYVYDGFGRAITVPGNDTPLAQMNPADETIEYYVDDAVRSLGGTVYERDAVGRVTTGDGFTRYYTDSTDAATWTKEGVDVERFVPGLNGDLAAILKSGGTAAGGVEIPIVDPHGDILTQVLLPTSGDATGIPSWFPVDEYGNQLQLWFTAFGLFPTQISDGIWDGGMAYGWLGAKEREIHASGLMLMGARVYNPYNGSFTSVDPVFGGNTTVYAYPQDPINIFDLTGEMAALAVAGLVAGVSVSQVLAVIAITVLAAIGIKAIWKGTAWAKKQITTLYNKSKHAKKRQGQRGISSDMINQTIKTGRKIKGNTKSTTKYKGKKIWVVVNNKTGKVVSTGWN